MYISPVLCQIAHKYYLVEFFKLHHGVGITTTHIIRIMKLRLRELSDLL